MIDLKKLGNLLSEKYMEITRRVWDSTESPGWNEMMEIRLDEAWIEYLNAIDCVVLGRDEVRDCFQSIVNESAQGRVCVIIDADGDYEYVLMDRRLAEKSLVLGGLPDSWLPETPRPVFVYPGHSENP